MNDHCKNAFVIRDKYDILVAEYEARRAEYAHRDADDDFDIEAYKRRLFGGIRPREVFVLEKYVGGEVDVRVPDGVSEVASTAFGGNTDIRSVYLPDSVKTIAAGAFSDCAKLSGVRLGAGTKVLNFDTFKHCSELAHIDLPHGLERIYGGAFAHSGLADIFIPANVTDIASDAFSYCNALEHIEVDRDNPHYYSRDNCVYHRKNRWLIVGQSDGALPNDGSFTAIWNDAFAGNSRVRSVVVPDGVKRLDDSAFAHCENLSRISLPATLDSLGVCLFDGCAALKEITVPGGVKTIERMTFCKCGAQKIVFKRGVEFIDEQAFFGCGNLREVYIPQTVRYIAADAFDGCIAEPTVYFQSNDIPPALDGGVNAVCGCISDIYN